MLIDSFEAAMALSVIAQRAGSEIMAMKNNASPKQKEDGSPVTLADLKSNEIIINAISEIWADVPIVSEEGSVGDPMTSVHCFLVDPLDGTKEYLKENGMYTVNIALMSRQNDNRWVPILGVVHAPEITSTWIGGKEFTAVRQDEFGFNEIRVNRNSRPPIILGSISHPSVLDLSFAEDLGLHEFIPMGSSLKICRVADGFADLSPRFGPTSCWDTAAAHAVLNSAGGNLMSPEGLELTYDVVDNLLNPWFIATSSDRWIGLWLKYQKTQ
jgi:3'(2'), 5'-bisphosphate nucleotidase